MGLESGDGMSAADILHVRQGQNYLVDDFTRIDRLRDDPAAMAILARVAQEIGFEMRLPLGDSPVDGGARPTPPGAAWAASIAQMYILRSLQG